VLVPHAIKEFRIRHGEKDFLVPLTEEIQPAILAVAFLDGFGGFAQFFQAVRWVVERRNGFEIAVAGSFKQSHQVKQAVNAFLYRRHFGHSCPVAFLHWPKDPHFRNVI